MLTARSPASAPAAVSGIFALEQREGIRQSAIILAKVCSAAVQGIEAYPVEVEANVGWGDTNVAMLLC